MSTDDTLTTATQLFLPKPVRLRLGTLVGYGCAAMGQFASDLTINLLLQIFLLDTAKGIIQAAAEIMEMIGSVLIGVLSDNTKSKRFGKRRPWIFWGSICGALALLLLFFTVPDDWNDEYRFLYYLCAIVLSSGGFMAESIPHQALGAEITDDYDQRLNLSSARSVFSFLGMLAMAVYILLVFTFGVPTGEYQLWLVIAALPASLTVVFGIVCFLSVPSNQREEKIGASVIRSKRNACVRSLQLFRIFPFLLVVMIFALAGLVSSVTLSLLPLFLVHVLELGMDTFSQVLIVMVGAMVLSIFVLSRVGRKFEKRTLLMFGSCLGMVTYSLYFWVPGLGYGMDNLRYIVFGLAALSGITNALAFTIPNAMMADVTDVAMLRNKAKQEGLMFSSMEMLQSLVQALTGFLIGYRLDEIGYVNAGTQPNEVKSELRLYFSAVPVAAFALVWLLAAAYPINRRRHKKVLQGIRMLAEVDVADDVRPIQNGLLAGNAMWEAPGTVRLLKKREQIVRNASFLMHAEALQSRAESQTVPVDGDDQKSDRDGANPPTDRSSSNSTQTSS